MPSSSLGGHELEPVEAQPVQQMPASLTPFTLEAPDLIEPLTGFRCWRVVGGRLRSPYLPVFWDEPLLPAQCHRQTAATDVLPPHQPPHAKCDCGIHAYHEPNLDFPAVDYRGVAGIVTLRGRVAVGEHGMRAEIARVEALGFYSRWSRRQKREVTAIAGQLQVDLVDLEDLPSSARDYGRPLLPHLLSRARAAEPSSRRNRPQTGGRLTPVG